MAKNFASVLDALKFAGTAKQAEVEKSYAANCEWLLQQFKVAQASFAELNAEGKAGEQVQQVCPLTSWSFANLQACDETVILQSTAKSRKRAEDPQQQRPEGVMLTFPEKRTIKYAFVQQTTLFLFNAANCLLH